MEQYYCAPRYSIGLRYHIRYWFDLWQALLLAYLYQSCGVIPSTEELCLQVIVEWLESMQEEGSQVMRILFSLQLVSINDFALYLQIVHCQLQCLKAAIQKVSIFVTDPGQLPAGKLNLSALTTQKMILNQEFSKWRNLFPSALDFNWLHSASSIVKL